MPILIAEDPPTVEELQAQITALTARVDELSALVVRKADTVGRDRDGKPVTASQSLSRSVWTYDQRGRWTALEAADQTDIADDLAHEARTQRIEDALDQPILPGGA